MNISKANKAVNIDFEALWASTQHGSTVVNHTDSTDAKSLSLDDEILEGMLPQRFLDWFYEVAEGCQKANLIDAGQYQCLLECIKDQRAVYDGVPATELKQVVAGTTMWTGLID